MQYTGMIEKPHETIIIYQINNGGGIACFNYTAYYEIVKTQ